MSDLDHISDQIRLEFDRKTARRDAALAHARKQQQRSIQEAA